MLRYGDVVTLRFESFVGNDINPHSWARRLRLAKASQDNTPLSPRVAAPESRNESSLREVRAAFARAGPSEGVVCSTDKIHNHECYLCHADDPAVLRQSDRRKCLFQLIPQLSYTAKAELQRALDRVAVPRHRGASSSGHAARTKTRRVTAEHSNAERPRSASQENSLSRKSSSFLLRRRSVTNLGRILSTDGDEPGAGRAAPSEPEDASVERLDDLREALELEEKQNLATQQKHFGRPVVYGGITQLRHVSTGKYLTLDARQVADAEHDCLKVFLAESGSPSSWLELQAPYSVWDEGALIETDSAVKLRFRDFKQNFLHCGVVGEVNASAAGSLFQIHRFQAFAPHSAQMLQVGSVVRLVHPQTSRYLIYDHISSAYEAARAHASEAEALADAASENLPTLQNIALESVDAPHFNASCSLWIVETNSFETAAARWTDKFFLRHLNTHKLLGISPRGELFVGDGFRFDTRDFELSISAVSRAIDAKGSGGFIELSEGFLLGRKVLAAEHAAEMFHRAPETVASTAADDVVEAMSESGGTCSASANVVSSDNDHIISPPAKEKVSTKFSSVLASRFKSSSPSQSVEFLKSQLRQKFGLLVEQGESTRIPSNGHRAETIFQDTHFWVHCPSLAIAAPKISGLREAAEKGSHNEHIGASESDSDSDSASDSSFDVDEFVDMALSAQGVQGDRKRLHSGRRKHQRNGNRRSAASKTHARAGSVPSSPLYEQPLSLGSTSARDLRDSFRFELVRMEEVYRTDEALGDIKRFRTLARSFYKTSLTPANDPDTSGDKSTGSTQAAHLPAQQWLAEVLDVVGSLIFFCTDLPQATQTRLHAMHGFIQKAEFLLLLKKAQSTSTATAQPNVKNQKLVREQGGIGITFWVLEQLTALLDGSSVSASKNDTSTSPKQSSTSAVDSAQRVHTNTTDARVDSRHTSHSRWMKVKQSARTHTMEAIANIRTTCSLLYFFLSCTIAGNPLNQQKAAEWMDDMIKHVLLEVGAADCLTRMLHNNRKLLSGRLVQDKHVDGFVRMITRGGIMPLALKFLQVLCATQREGTSLTFDAVGSMQALVCEALRRNEAIHFRFRLKNNECAGRPGVDVIPPDLTKLYGDAARVSSESQNLATSAAAVHSDSEEEDSDFDKFHTLGSDDLLHDTTGEFVLHDIEVTWNAWGPSAAHMTPQSLYGVEWVNLRTLAKRAHEYNTMAMELHERQRNKQQTRPRASTARRRAHSMGHQNSSRSQNRMSLNENVSHVVSSSESVGKSSIPAAKAHADVLNYLVTSLKLYATLCMQRNYTGILWLEQRLPYNICLAGLVHPRHDPNIRRAFMRLMVHLWIDRSPQRPVSAPFLTRHWQSQQAHSRNMEVHMQGVGGQLHMLAGPASHQVHRPKPKLRTQKTRFRHLRSHADHPQSVSGEAIADRPDHPGRFVLLQAFILQYFRRLPKTSASVRHSNSLLLARRRARSGAGGRAASLMERQMRVADQRLTVEIGLGLRMLSKMGFYATLPAFLELSQHLVALLDGRTDHVDDTGAPNNSNISGAGRDGFALFIRDNTLRRRTTSLSKMQLEPAKGPVYAIAPNLAAQFNSDDDDSTESEADDGTTEGETHNGDDSDGEATDYVAARDSVRPRRSKSSTLKLQPKMRQARRCTLCCSKRTIDAVINSTPYTFGLLVCVPLSMITVVMHYLSDSVVGTLAEEWTYFLVDAAFMTIFAADVILRSYLMTWKRYTRDVLCVVDFLVSSLDVLSFLFAVFSLANYNDIASAQVTWVSNVGSVVELSPILRLTRFSRTIRLLRVARVVRAVTLAQKVKANVEETFVPAPPSELRLFRYRVEEGTRSVTQIKIVAVDLLRTFGRLNDDIRLNRLVTNCQSLFAKTSEESASKSLLGGHEFSGQTTRGSASPSAARSAIISRQPTIIVSSQPARQSSRPPLSAYISAFNTSVQKLFEHRHHLVNEVDTGRLRVSARAQQAKVEAVVQQYHSNGETTSPGTAAPIAVHTRMQALGRGDPLSHRIHPISSTSPGAHSHRNGIGICATESPNVDTLHVAANDEMDVEELSDSTSDTEDEGVLVAVPPTYTGLLPHEQTMQWLLAQKFSLYFHGSRIWANHEDLRRIPGTIVSGGMLEHDVDAILMDLLLYDDLELALKALTLLIQKYRRWESLRDTVCGVQMLGSTSEFQHYAILRGHLVALEHLFEEYEAWKVLDNEQAVEAKTQRVFHSISVIKLLLTPPRVGASSPRHHGPSDRPSPFRSGSSFLRSHVASSPESSCGQRTSQKQAQQALVHLGFADLIDTAFDIPSECDDFPSWWWNAPGRPDLTGENQSSRSTMPETRPNVVIATFGGNIEMLRANDTVIKFQDSSAARRQQSGRIRRAKPLVAEQSTQLTDPPEVVVADTDTDSQRRTLSTHEDSGGSELSLMLWMDAHPAKRGVRRNEHRRRVMLGWLNELLLGFADSNADNQRLLFEKIRIFIRNIGHVQHSDQVVAAIFSGNLELCRLASPQLVHGLIVQMERSFHYGVFAQGLVSALTSIAMSTKGNQSHQIRDTIITSICARALNLGFYTHTEKRNSVLHQIIHEASTKLRDAASWTASYIVEFVPGSQRSKELKQNLDNPAKVSAESPREVLQGRQPSRRLRRRQTSQTQFESVPRHRRRSNTTRSLPPSADIRADQQRHRRRLQHFVGAAPFMHAHMSTMRLLLACCGSGVGNDSLLAQKCQTLYPAATLTALVCEPDILWNARVIYIDLLSSLYIDTAAPTKGFVSESNLPGVVDVFARTIQVYSSMNAQRPDLQLELQNFLVQPGLEGGAKLDPLRHSVVADLRQHPAFFLTHLYCQVLPVLATFMNRYGPNLYMASLRSSTHLKDSLSNILHVICELFRSTSSIERWFGSSTQDDGSSRSAVVGGRWRMGDRIQDLTSTTLLQWRLALCIAQFEDVFELLLWDSFDPKTYLDEKDIRALKNAVASAQRFEVPSGDVSARASLLVCSTWPHFPVLAEHDIEEYNSSFGKRRLPRRRGGPPVVEQHSLPQIFERCAQLAFGQGQSGGSSQTTFGTQGANTSIHITDEDTHGARASRLRQNLVKQMMSLPQTINGPEGVGDQPLDSCTLPNVLQRMIVLVQHSLEPVPGERFSLKFGSPSLVQAASQVVSILKAIVDSVGVHHNGSGVVRRTLPALQEQVSLVGGVELVLALVSSSVPDDLFLKAVELGIVLVAAERVPAQDVMHGVSSSPPSEFVNVTPPTNDFFRRIGLTNFVACNSKMQRHFFQRLLHEAGASEAFMLGVRRRLELAMQVVARTKMFADEEHIPELGAFTSSRIESPMAAHQTLAQQPPPSNSAVLRLHTQIPKGIGEAAAGAMHGASSATPSFGRKLRDAQNLPSRERLPFGQTPSAWSLRMVQMLYLLVLSGSETHKSLFKEQAHAAVSVNLLDTIVKYFGTFAERFCISPSILTALAVSSNLLCALLDGPCKKNQVHLATRTDLLDTVNHLLRCLAAAHDTYARHLPFMNRSRTTVSDRKKKVSSMPLSGETEEWYFDVLMLLYRVEENLLRLCLGMIDGLSNPTVVEKVHTTLKFHLWLERLGSMRKLVHGLGGRELELPPSPSIEAQRRYSIVQKNLTIGHSLMMLVHYIGELFPEWYQHLMERAATTRAPDYFDTGLRRVEVFWCNRVHAAYFPTLAMCKSIPQARLDSLLESVDRQNHDTKLNGFTSIAKDLYISMRHSALLKQKRLDVLFSERKLMYTQNTKFALALLINGFIFLFMEASHSDSHDQELLLTNTWLQDSFLDSAGGPDAFVQVLGYLQLFAALYVMVCRYVLSLPIFYARHHSILAAMLDPQVVYPLAYVAVCAVGLWSGFLYVYCFCFLDIVERSKNVQHVLFAVTRPIRQIMLTMTLLLIVLIIYGYTVFYFNREKVDTGECYSMFSCVLWVIYVGARYGGGIADGINDYDIYFEQATWLSVSFLIGLSFYVVVNLILLNLVFGIIIDKFAELRQDRDTKLYDQENFCFICGLSRREFEMSQQTNFHTHTKQVHNPWAYLQYIVYISEKPRQSLSGIERHVARCLDVNKIKWFPQGFASDLVLHGVANESNGGTAVDDNARHIDANGRVPNDNDADHSPALPEAILQAIQKLDERMQTIEQLQALSQMETVGFDQDESPP